MRFFPVLIAAACCHSSLLLADQSDAAIDYGSEIRPLITKYCSECHGLDVQESNVRLDNLSTDLLKNRATAETWHEVLNVLDAGEMPPTDESQPTEAERVMFTEWVRGQVDAAIEARQATDGRVVLRRLNRIEYQNTMTDLLGMEMDYARDLPPDGTSADGFTNNGQSLQMTALQLEYYLDAARRGLERVIVSGLPPQTYEYTFTESNLNKWKGNEVRSNRLQRRQDFLATMKDDYPEVGNFIVRVTVSAELQPDKGFPLLEVSVGYRPDTQILMESFDLVELTSAEEQTFEFRGRMENFPLPVRGQGKFPGLVVRLRNVYDDGTAPPNKAKNEAEYPDEPTLPAIIVKSVDFKGPVFDQWPPAEHRRLLPKSDLQQTDERAYMVTVLKDFMSRAFRRPVDSAEVDRMASFFEEVRPEFPTFEEAARETLAMVLVSPDFLYLMEPAGDNKRPLNNWELASRLSYFLWSTMPDEELLGVAVNGALSDKSVLAAQVERMIHDPRSQQFVDQFTDQWLHLGFIENVSIDTKEYRGFNDDLKRDMIGESKHVFAELLAKNRSCDHFLSSDFTMLNERLARHYGIDGVYGHRFRPVSLKEDATNRRGGLLTHASVLMINSTGRDSHPIRRAVWLRDRLLNDPPPPPPPDVPTLEDSPDPNFANLPVREQLKLHRQKAACDSCHRNIDPWGIALENYNAIGLIRSTGANDKNDSSIDTSAILPNGDKFSGATELQEYLLNHRREQFAESLVSRLMTYALGRRLELSDQKIIDDIVADSLANDFRLADLVQKVVLSRPFLTK